VRCGQKSEDAVDEIISIHRQILGLTKGDSRVGDHIDPWDTLDNRRGNLRIATIGQNARNCKTPYALPSSGVRGASFNPRKNNFRVRVCFEGKKYSFGSRKTAEEAGRLYEQEFNRLVKRRNHRG
jgi:hypothetical protein